MSESQPSTGQPSPHAEQLRQAMGWDRLPEMTPEQLAAFDAAEAEADEAARRFYSSRAA